MLNVVFTPATFRALHLFAASLLHHSEVGVRLVANGCGGEELELMEEFARRHDRVVEVRAVSASRMVKHGRALEQLYRSTCDGEYFCFIDSDMKATGPFMQPFLELLTRCAAVTSGRVAWGEDTVAPRQSLGLAGRHLVAEDGFVYGSSYFAMYRRTAVDETRERWGIGFLAYRGKELPEPVAARLADLGRRFSVYDTAKVMNIALQADGHQVHHHDVDDLVHIGGMSSYLSNPTLGIDARSQPERFVGAEFAAATLLALIDRSPLPPVPAALPDDRKQHLAVIAAELTDLVARYGD